MIPDENIALLEAARAIAAGRPVDWAAIESSGAVSDSLAALLEELKVVANIAELHRSLPYPSLSSEDSAASLTSNALDVPGVTLGRAAMWGSLRLLERVGEGAFGDVFRAWDPRLDREVALKLLKRRDSRGDLLGSAVIEEGRMLARVRHPNVVTVYGADRIDGRVGVWMEFVHGRTIEAVLSDHGPFGAQEAALIGLDVCRALSAVHRADLIHRDIKAQNVMREAGGRIVLMDFGTGLDDLAGRPAEMAGTPLYVAPEVFAGSPATIHSDIYSVGVLLYHLVTGSYPVKGRTIEDVREAHRLRRRSWLRGDRPDLPDTFIQVVERAMAFDAPDRFETAGAMEAALTRFVSRADSPADAAPAPIAAPAVAPPPSIKRRGWLAAAALALLAAAMATLVPSWRARMLGARRAGPPAQRTAAASTESSVVLRRVTMPPFSLIGAPSADGKLISVSDIDGNVAVFDLAAGKMRPITTDAVLEKDSQYAEFTAISYDGQFIAYAWFALDGKYELRVVDIEGKRPRVLLRNAAIDYPIPIQWSRDGASILTTIVHTDRSVQLALVSADDGTIRPVRDLGTTRPQYASLSPDGEFIVYDAPQERTAASRDVFIVRSNGTDNRRLVQHQANDANPTWTPDGRHVLFASDRSGTMDVWSVAVESGVAQAEPQVVHRNVGRMWLRGLTETGSYFYYVTAGTVEVYEAQLTDAAVKNPAALPSSYSGSNISSSWSHDGHLLAYASRRGLIGFDRGSTTLAIRNVATKEQREVVPAMNDFLVRSWSPDGRYVLVQGSDATGRGGTFTIDTTSGNAPPDFLGPMTRPVWLADGRIVYFNLPKNVVAAREADTNVEHVLVDLKAEGINLVASVNGRGFGLSPDGQTLAYTNAAREAGEVVQTIGVKVVGGGPPRELVRAAPNETVLFQDWTRDGTALLFTRWTPAPGAKASLWRVPISGGDPRPLGLAMEGVRDVSVHPDGTKITFTAGWPRNELWVMENFLAEWP